MQGDEQGGFTIFWADDGLDTGPILLERRVDIDPNDTVDTLYNRFLYPEGIKGMVRPGMITNYSFQSSTYVYYHGYCSVPV